MDLDVVPKEWFVCKFCIEREIIKKKEGPDYDYFDDPKVPDHFHPDYMKDVKHPFEEAKKETQLDFWKRMKTLCDQSNNMALENFERLGKEIINLTPESQCDIFVKGDIEDYV